MADVSDATLLIRFRAGDRQALELLLARHEAALFQFLVGMLRDRHQAEDVLQETFVRSLERLDDVDPAHLRGWLFTVAYHQAMLYRRKQRTRPTLSLPDNRSLVDTEALPAEQAASRDDAVRLQRLLTQLPAVQQEVIRQRVYEGKRFREIADTLGCPLNTALARMHDGIKRLRLLWGEDHG